MRKNKGAISIFAILSMMFFLIFIMVAYNNVFQKSKEQIETEIILSKYYKITQTANEIELSKNYGNVKLDSLKEKEQKLEVLNSGNNNKYMYSNGSIYKIDNNSKEYQRVEYIESTGTQYIDTGISPSKTTIWELKFKRTTNSSANNGSVAINNTQRFRIDHNSFGLGAYYWLIYPTIGEEIIARWDANIPEIYINNVGSNVNGLTSVSNDINIYLFAENVNNSSIAYGISRIYYSRIWNEGILVRDFIPCYRVSDNVIGLYDIVNDKFYTNAGTGTFIKGTDV